MARRISVQTAFAVRAIRGLAKLHRIFSREIAEVSGINVNTIGGILSGFADTPIENISRMWEATLTLAAARIRTAPEALRKEKEKRIAAEAKLARIKEVSRQLSEL